MIRTSYLVALLLTMASVAQAQDASLLQQPARNSQGLTLQSSSFVYQELPPEARPRALQINDIITVIVDYRTQMLSEGDAESRKTANLSAALTDWLRFDGGSLKPAPQSDGAPTVTANLISQYRAESDIELRDSLSFRIGAKIVDIRPNGNLVIEAHQSIQVNEELWQISLTGVVPRESIQADRTISSNSIAELKIVKGEDGQVRDGYARGWLGRIYDRLHPF